MTKTNGTCLAWGLACLAPLLGCGTAEEGAATAAADQDLTGAAAAFDRVEHDFTIELSSLAPLQGMDASQCTAWLHVPTTPSTYARHERNVSYQRLAATSTFRGALFTARHRTEVRARLELRCHGASAEAASETEVVFSGLSPAKVGRRETVTGKVQGGAPFQAKLELVTKAVTPSAAKVVSNCDAFAGAPPGDVARFLVRATTEVDKSYPWTAPYGNDWVVRLELDGGKLSHDYRPKLEARGELVAVYCRAAREGETLALKLRPKEDDLFFDDEYEAFEQTSARGVEIEEWHGPEKAVEGPSGGSRAVRSTIEVL